MAGSGPGFLILLKGIDFYPAFEDRHGTDVVSLVKQFLDEIREGRLTDAAGFLKAGGFVPFVRPR